MDRDDIADNLIKKWNEDVGDALEVSTNLVNLATEVYQQAIVEDDENEGSEEEDENVFDVEAALKSEQYKTYLQQAAELQKVEILHLKQYQKVAFFLNVYQCMYVHHFLRKVFEEGIEEEKNPNGGAGLMSHLSTYVFAYSPKPFFYNIAGFMFSLEDIKHGLLRNNQRSPFNYMRSMNANDNRLDILKEFEDPRISFVCLDYRSFLENIEPFDGSSEETLEMGLEEFCSDIINAKVNIETDQGEITLPKVLEDYKADFGN